MESYRKNLLNANSPNYLDTFHDSQPESLNVSWSALAKEAGGSVESVSTSCKCLFGHHSS